MKHRRPLTAPLATALKRADALLPAIGLSRRVERLQDAVAALEQCYDALLSSRERALRQLSAENRLLKQRLSELSHDKAMLQNVARRSLPQKSQRKRAIDYLVTSHGLELRKARKLLGLPRKSLLRLPHSSAGAQWNPSLPERAQQLVWQGYREVNVVIQKQGWLVGRRLAYRVYVDEPRKQLSKQVRKAVMRPAGWLKRLRPKR